MRIVVCGLAGEGYEQLEAKGWECTAWTAHGGYGNRRAANTNNLRERFWSSPACLEPELLFRRQPAATADSST